MGPDAVHRGQEEPLTPGWASRLAEKEAVLGSPARKSSAYCLLLAIGQVIGWGTVGLLAVVGRQVAADLHMDISAVFAGNSIFYVVMGLWAPFLARAFTRFGARRVMIAGTVIGAPGFVLLSLAHGPVLYCTAWVILGSAGSATLATATYILLNEIAGRDARRAIGALDAGDGTFQQHLLADHFVSFGRGRLARHLSGLCRDVGAGVPSALCLRVATSS